MPARWERVARAVEIRDEQGSKTLIFGNGDVRGVAHAHELAKETGADGVMLGRAIFGNPWLFHPSKCLPERMTLSAASSSSHRTNEYDSFADSPLPRPASQEDTLSIPAIEWVTVEERLNALLEHTRLFEELLPHKNFAIMKKHYKAYVNGFDGAKELRMELMEAANADEVETVIRRFK